MKLILSLLMKNIFSHDVESTGKRRYSKHIRVKPEGAAVDQTDRMAWSEGPSASIGDTLTQNLSIQQNPLQQARKKKGPIVDFAKIEAAEMGGNFHENACVYGCLLVILSQGATSKT